MKKIITAALVAAMLLSFGACDSGKDEPEQTTAQTTVAVTEDPANAPTVITVEDVKAVIDAAKKEYADATSEIKLSDGTVLSTDLKDPMITVESISDGTATDEQMGNYAMYLVNIRKLVCDRLINAFSAGNTMVFSTAEKDLGVGDFIFLDPKGAGYDSVSMLLTDMADEDKSKDLKVDYVYIRNSIVTLFDGETGEATLLCPTDEENAILAAIAAKLNPDMLTEKVTETSAVTE